MRKKLITSLFILATLLIVIQSCKKFEPRAPKADEVMDAPLEGLTHAQNKLFLQGAEEFDEVYTSESGLGPVFVANSCGSCHAGDNRGHLSTILTRFGQNDTTGNKFMQFGGPQIQNHAIIGHNPEQLPSTATSSKFIAPIAAGVGFLELVSDADIIAMSDPNDNDGDGISGVPNWKTIPTWVTPSTNAVQQNGKYICRFGRKAAAYNLHQQTVGAFNQDMGVTSTFFPQNPFNYTEGLNPVATSDPEISDEGINATVFYLQVLQAPIQRNTSDDKVKHGANVFVNIGCEKCHKQNLKTGASPIPALSNKDFHPFTDLLLHDMGSGLDDNYTEGSAMTYEWRTTPLWGLGLAKDSQGGAYYLLHDGRARTIDDAIQQHGGESLKSANEYRNLSQTDKDDLIKFLESL